MNKLRPGSGQDVFYLTSNSVRGSSSPPSLSSKLEPPPPLSEGDEEEDGFDDLSASETRFGFTHNWQKILVLIFLDDILQEGAFDSQQQGILFRRHRRHS